MKVWLLLIQKFIKLKQQVFDFLQFMDQWEGPIWRYLNFLKIYLRINQLKSLIMVITQET